MTYHDDEDPSLSDDGYYRLFARVAAVVSCMTLLTLGLLGALAYQSWALAHGTYF